MPVADVWVLDVERLAADGRLGAYREALSPPERERSDGFRCPADRDAYVAAHGLARAALSTRRPGVPPRAWRFLATPQGRLEVADAPLRFNLSHTRRTVACVVTSGADCGIDVEQVDPRVDVDLLARGVLTAAERAALDGAAPGTRELRFFRHWTLKEAYAKARGLGLSLPLDSYGFDLAPASPVLVDAPDDDPAVWRFTQWRHDATTVVAAALRGDHSVDRHDDPP